MRLYHNPRCSKSRQAVALLKERGVAFEEWRYLTEGVHDEDLTLLAGLAGIVRKSDLETDIDLSDEKAIRDLLRSNPKPMQRPVLVHKGRAVIGRPPEDILQLLD
ncbi:MAG TPA: arsenate reductase (glutaredoxin) [Candidatus Poseidoniaceae archaeon]|nr:MAG: arsenate reductase (glutaredoxin) [Euryarchaeota archaeon TMED141]DAC10697.1 MAG TPA: arsenate reductase (glutaredoxin) [Candidatus Poseidoniales archaeon]DAC18335.1 MAG TPA: arsenate reductase (glutaredoxin) [Candidatus Poseidoniales archaeon]HII18279.1 arsenate reductase (glutaredoxin) [Candidatus Poseidoniaceae archaeon]HII96470.1 arsenate reductase (glutaredoxin) [Candidatus Poseidoniaceae archaeon]